MKTSRLISSSLIAIATLTAVSACSPRESAEVPFQNANPYRIEATRVVDRTSTVPAQPQVQVQQVQPQIVQQPIQVQVQQQAAVVPAPAVAETKIDGPIYFSEKTGHILVPKTKDGERVFVRSNKVLDAGRVYFNTATGERLQVKISDEGKYKLVPIGGSADAAAS